MVKNLPAMQETRVRSLGQENPLEKGMETHSSILAWGIPWTEEPGGLQSMGSQKVGHDWVTNFHFHFVFQWTQGETSSEDRLACFLGSGMVASSIPMKILQIFQQSAALLCVDVC